MTKDERNSLVSVAYFDFDVKKEPVYTSIDSPKSVSHTMSRRTKEYIENTDDSCNSHSSSCKCLVNYNDVDPIFQESYILTGYRKNYDVKDSFHSVFELHNETCNIWTHISGLFIFLGFLMWRFPILSEFYKVHPGAALSLMSFYIFSAICMFFSALYHILRNISVAWQSTAYLLDLCGVWSMILGQYVTMVCIYLICNPEHTPMHLNICVVTSFIAIGAQFVFPCPKPKYLRVTPMVIFSICALTSIITWYRQATEIQLMQSLVYFLCLFACYVFGFSVWLVKFPECFFPGIFDGHIFSSHSIWHMMIITGALCYEKAMIRAVGLILDNNMWCSGHL